MTPTRVAVRHGREAGEVTLGGRRVGVQRPRVRAADGSSEIALKTYAHFADRDPLTRVVLDQMLAGVSTRRFEHTREPVGQGVIDAERSTSKSAVSREFVERTSEHLRALMARDLGDVRLAALMLDGIELKGRCCVVALGVSTDGVKIPLGLWDGSTENATVARHLLADLVHRGLDVEQGVLVVLDGGKALRSAVNEVLGPVPVQRCIRHKERNVLDHLPEHDRPTVKRRLRAAWKQTDHVVALDGLTLLANELARSHPGAAASLREGLAETLTLQRLGCHEQLRRTLASTDENVKAWSGVSGWVSGVGSVGQPARWAADRFLWPGFRVGRRDGVRFRACSGRATAAGHWARRSAGVRLRCGRGRPPSEAQDLGLSPAAQLLPRLRALRVAPRWRRPRPILSSGPWPASRRRAGDRPARPAR